MVSHDQCLHYQRACKDAVENAAADHQQDFSCTNPSVIVNQQMCMLEHHEAQSLSFWTIPLHSLVPDHNPKTIHLWSPDYGIKLSRNPYSSDIIAVLYH